MGDRLKQAFQRESELEIRRKVEALFEANRVSPNPSRKIPIIGEARWAEYDPHGSPEQHAEFMELAVKALLARKWFETQLPPFMQPLQLPLCEAERIALNNTSDRRSPVVARYGMTLQQYDWEYWRAPPFIDYYAQSR